MGAGPVGAVKNALMPPEPGTVHDVVRLVFKCLTRCMCFLNRPQVRGEISIRLLDTLLQEEVQVRQTAGTATAVNDKGWTLDLIPLPSLVMQRCAPAPPHPTPHQHKLLICFDCRC